MARLYLDEDVPRSVADHLRVLGHDVLTVREAGKDGRGIPDDEVLAFACEEGRAVVTKNRKHFKQLHAKGSGHSGIITFTEDREYEALAGRIHEAIKDHADLAGCLVRVVRPPS